MAFNLQFSCECNRVYSTSGVEEEGRSHGTHGSREAIAGDEELEGTHNGGLHTRHDNILTSRDFHPLLDIYLDIRTVQIMKEKEGMLSESRRK